MAPILPVTYEDLFRCSCMVGVSPSSALKGLFCHACRPGPAARTGSTGRAACGAEAAYPGVRPDAGALGRRGGGAVPDRAAAAADRRTRLVVGPALRRRLRHRRVGAGLGGADGAAREDAGCGPA